MARRNPHIGEQQLPLITPDSCWKPPTELPDLRGKRFALDLETKDDSLSAEKGPGWPYKAGYIVGVGVAWAGGRVYVPIRHPEDNYHEPDRVKDWVRDIVRAAPTVVFQNAHYDLGWMRAEWDILTPGHVDDTIAMAVMVDETQPSYSLDALARWAKIEGKDETLLRETAAAYALDPKKDLWRLPARFVGPYGEQDPAATLDLAEFFWPKMVEEQTTRAYENEMALVPMVHEMRWRGIRLDLDRCDRGKREILVKRDEVLAELARNIGKSTVTIEEIRSNKVMEAWHQDAGIRVPRTAPTKNFPNGQPSFSKEWMRGHDHWLPRLADRAEYLTEAAEKFIQSYLMDYSHRGRLHASINQYRSEDGGTRTSRFSYADPPLQQMPHRNKEIMQIIRAAFLPEEGEVFLSADYSQQEYRLIVSYAAKMNLAGAAAAAARYRDDPNTDFHQYVADITGLERKPAKDANFAKSYGAGVPKFASMTGRSEAEAAAIMEQYDQEMPFVKRLNEKCDSLAQKRGYIRLLDGARMHYNFWEIADRKSVAAVVGGAYPSMNRRPAMEVWCDNFEAEHGWRPRLRRADTRKAMNGLIQGGAARQTKLAMIECWREGLVPLLQMHDELDFSVTSREQVARVGEIMRSIAADELLVPMRVDLETGPNWADVKADWWPGG